jgi:hypothetical protein
MTDLASMALEVLTAHVGNGLPSQIVFDPTNTCGIECINLFKGLYKAFQRWCRMCGERMPPNQAYFSTAVTKYARDRLSNKKASPSPLDSGSAITLWLPKGTGPLDGVRWFDYARECVAAFEGPLSRFGSSYQDSTT